MFLEIFFYYVEVVVGNIVWCYFIGVVLVDVFGVDIVVRNLVIEVFDCFFIVLEEVDFLGVVIFGIVYCFVLKMIGIWVVGNFFFLY